jgi:nitroimidazol reductase NimA-like FMN-containing flavoprotein (pyridoxamine 5'-phosphate oxidase superfamily)
MATARLTEFVALDEIEARAFLARQHVGRIAFTHRDRVDIEPISYTFDRGWILGRTSVGTKLATLAHHPWCAFEADVISSPFEWTSVVVKGTFTLLDPETGSPDVYARALASSKALVPEAFSESDPAPHRIILFGIYASEVSGRCARRSTR